MPQVIAAAIVALAPATGAIVIGTLTVASILGTVIFMAGMAAYSAHQAKKAKEKQREAYNSAQVDRLANIVTTTAPRDLVLGRVRKGGPVAFRGSAGAVNETFLLHVMLAGHEIDAVERVYMNDKRVTLDANGYVLDRPYLQLERFTATHSVASPVAGHIEALPLPTGLVSPPSVADFTVSAFLTTSTEDSTVNFTVIGDTIQFPDGASGAVTINYMYDMEVPYARVWWDLGTTTTTADARTLELFPDLWSAQHRGRGVAKLIGEFTYNENAFPTGVPQLTARIRGAKVYDPRSATTAWSENPALLARHVYQHAYFGKATVSSDEDARFIAAANACDISHGYVVDGVTETRPMFTAGLVGQFGAPAASLLDDLTQAMGGMWAFAGGELYIRAGVYTSPVMDLDDSDLATTQMRGDSESQEQVSISVHRERAEKFNTINLRIWDGGQDYKPSGLPPVKGSALVTRDGVELAQEITLTAVSHAAQAQHIAGIMMRDARDPLTVEAPFKMTAYPLELFDVVRLTLARYGWVNKTFMVVGRTWHHDKGVIKLTLKETAAAIFNPDASFKSQGYADNTRLPTPWDITGPVLTAAGVTSGTDELILQSDGTIITRVRVTWAALTDARITSGGFIDIRWRPISSAQWQTVTVDGDATEAYLIGPKDRRAIIIRARSRTSIAKSAWSKQVAHIVVGKSEPPPEVEFFKVVSQPGGLREFFWFLEEPPVDLRGFQVRYVPGTEERRWDRMITLFSAGKDEREAERREPQQAGEYTFAIRTVDTTGNMSDPIYDTVTLYDFDTPERIVRPHDQDWPGTKTDCFLSGTSLADVGAATWNDVDIEWSLQDGWSNLASLAAVGTIAYEHTEVDMSTSIARLIRANSLSFGVTTVEFTYKALAGDVYPAWAEVPDTPVTGRYFKFRWTVTGTVPILYRASIAFYP